jgi:hypothetical protein
MTVTLDETIGSGEFEFRRVCLKCPEYACRGRSVRRHLECRLHWIPMRSSSSLRRPGRNTSSSRNTGHFGFDSRSTRTRRPLFSRSSCRLSWTSATAGYDSARRDARTSDFRGRQKPPASVTTRASARRPHDRSLEWQILRSLGMLNLLSVASSLGSGHGTSDRHLGGTVG